MRFQAFKHGKALIVHVGYYKSVLFMLRFYGLWCHATRGMGVCYESVLFMLRFYGLWCYATWGMGICYESVLFMLHP